MTTLSKSVLILAGVLAALSVAAAYGGFFVRPIRYEIDESFQGWVTVVYENSRCEPLPTHGLFLIVRVDAMGKGCTSTPMPRGWRYTKYVRVSKNGVLGPTLEHSSWASERSRMIWAGATMSPEGGYPFAGEIFFVGSAEQLKSAWSSQPIPKGR
jgi:hypothetical protein